MCGYAYSIIGWVLMAGVIVVVGGVIALQKVINFLYRLERSDATENPYC